MKKLSYLLVSIISVFTMISCMDDDDTPMTYGSFVTIEGSMFGYQLKPDFGNYVFIPTIDIGGTDLANYKRAFIYYTLPEGTTITENTTQIPIDLVSGSFGIPTSSMSNMPDTCGTNPIFKFSDFQMTYYDYYPSMWAQNGYVNISFIYYADKGAIFDLVQDSIKNDTLFLGFRVKKEGNSKSGNPLLCYKLPNYYQLENEGLVSENDSIIVSVAATVNEDISSSTGKIEYRRWKTKANY